MISLNDTLFAVWLLGCVTLIFFAPGKINKTSYSRLIMGIFALSCVMTIWFHETVVDVSQTSPLHAAMLILAQLLTLTLTSKIWLSFHLHEMRRPMRMTLYVIFYGALTAYIVGSYWLYKTTPELQLMLYPFASLAISLTAQIVEDRF